MSFIHIHIPHPSLTHSFFCLLATLSDSLVDSIEKCADKRWQKTVPISLEAELVTLVGRLPVQYEIESDVRNAKRICCVYDLNR